MSKNMNVPKLRFKEFGGEWEEKRLGDIAEVSSGGTPSRTNQNYWNGKIPWVTTTLIDFKIIDKAEELITEDGLKNSSAKIFPIGTILMAMYGQGKTRGKVGILGIEASTNQACGAIIVNKDKLNSLFLFHNLVKRYDEIRNLSNQGGQENLSGGIIKSIYIPYTTLKEQEKIASFLTSVDTRIEQLTKKEALLQEYKKGVMSKIFNQEIRFKDDEGREFPKWEDKKIKEIFEYKNGASFENDVIENGLYNLITLNSIDIKGELKNEHKKINVNNNSLNKNDLIMVLSDVAHGNFLGLVAIIPEDNKYVLNQRMGALKPKTNDNIPFIRMYINHNQKYFKLHGQGSSQQNLSKGDIEKFIVNLPCLQEQTKIANFLSSIDKKIELTTKELNSTKEFKKALLQTMFV